jgi:hypothetical protein
MNPLGPLMNLMDVEINSRTSERMVLASANESRFSDEVSHLNDSSENEPGA